MVKANAEREQPLFDGLNVPNRNIRMEEHSSRVPYEWHDRFDISDEEIATTLESYEDGAPQYSELEWQDPSIRISLETAFSRIRKRIDSLPQSETPVALVAGAGSFKDLLTLALMQYRIQVYGFDITPMMLKIGQEKLTWDNVVAFAAKLGEIDPSLNAWIAKIIELVSQAESLTDKDFSEWLTSSLEVTFQSKIHIFQGDLKNQYFRSNSVDIAMAVACLQHLKKSELSPVLIQFLSILKQNHGSFYFNLRLDSLQNEKASASGQRMSGRVFRDSVLATQGSQHTGDRYYTTFTISEVLELMDAVITEYEKLDPHSIIDCDVTDVSDHPDHSKPPFININVTKKPRK